MTELVVKKKNLMILQFFLTTAVCKLFTKDVLVASRKKSCAVILVNMVRT